MAVCPSPAKRSTASRMPSAALLFGTVDQHHREASRRAPSHHRVVLLLGDGAQQAVHAARGHFLRGEGESPRRLIAGGRSSASAAPARTGAKTGSAMPGSNAPTERERPVRSDAAASGR